MKNPAITSLVPSPPSSTCPHSRLAIWQGENFVPAFFCTIAQIVRLKNYCLVCIFCHFVCKKMSKLFARCPNSLQMLPIFLWKASFSTFYFIKTNACPMSLSLHLVFFGSFVIMLSRGSFLRKVPPKLLSLVQTILKKCANRKWQRVQKVCQNTWTIFSRVQTTVAFFAFFLQKWNICIYIYIFGNHWLLAVIYTVNIPGSPLMLLRGAVQERRRLRFEDTIITMLQNLWKAIPKNEHGSMWWCAKEIREKCVA